MEETPRSLRIGDRVKFRCKNQSNRTGRETFKFTVFRIDRNNENHQTCYASARGFGTVKFSWNIGSYYQAIHAFGASQRLHFAGRGIEDADAE